MTVLTGVKGKRSYEYPDLPFVLVSQLRTTVLIHPSIYRVMGKTGKVIVGIVAAVVLGAAVLATNTNASSSILGLLSQKPAVANPLDGSSAGPSSSVRETETQ